MKCPECRGKLVSPSEPKGEIVCQECGLVVSRVKTPKDFTEWTPEWFSNWDQNDSDTLREWLTTLRTMSCQLNLPSFPYREEAARIIRSKSNRLFRSQRFGKNKREAVAALIHIVLREYNEMRPLKEICQTIRLDPNLVFKYAWEMRKILDFDGSFTAKDYLKKYGSKLTLDTTFLRAAETILGDIQRKMSGNPASLAAGTLYLVCKSKGIKISKDEIGKVFSISGRTVYNRERKISKLIELSSFRLNFNTKRAQ